MIIEVSVESPMNAELQQLEQRFQTSIGEASKVALPIPKGKGFSFQCLLPGLRQVLHKLHERLECPHALRPLFSILPP